MHARSARYALAAALSFVASLAAAESTAIRAFPVTDRGTLQLNAPQSWPFEMRSAPNHALPTIALGPEKGATFQVLITPMPPPQKDPPASAGALKQMVEHAAQEATAQAVEKSLLVKELRSGAHVGYYFSATDRAPKSDEFKYMTQGMFSLGEMLIAFTILTNNGYESVVPAALTMIKNAVVLRNL